jgi:hypothetical protein
MDVLGDPKTEKIPTARGIREGIDCQQSGQVLVNEPRVVENAELSIRTVPDRRSK